MIRSWFISGALLLAAQCTAQETLAWKASDPIAEERDKLLADLRSLDHLDTEVIGNPDLNVYGLYAFVEASDNMAVLTPVLDRMKALMLQREQLLYMVTLTSPAVARLDHEIAIQKRLLIAAVAALRESLEERLELLEKLLRMPKRQGGEPKGMWKRHAGSVDTVWSFEEMGGLQRCQAA